MPSLATGKLVNRDQFFVMPMPELVIKKLNELALADGRVKGKGDLVKRTVTFEQDGDIRNGLPETMVTEVNNGVDPSVSLMDHNQELIYCETDQVMDDVGETQQDYLHIEESKYVDDMVPAQRVRVEPKAVQMDDLMSSFRQLAVGQPLASPHEDADEQGVPEDYGENGAIGTGITEQNSETLDEENRYSSVGHMVIPRQKLMNMLRGDRQGVALLTRNYNSAGGDLTEYVLNISVNEVLHTGGKDAECVIMKELSQMIEKKVWTPVDV